MGGGSGTAHFGSEVELGIRGGGRTGGGIGAGAAEVCDSCKLSLDGTEGDPSKGKSGSFSADIVDL